MKTKTFLTAIVFLLGSFSLLTAQNDVSLKSDGQEMVGKVAILPFVYVKDGVDGSNTMSPKIQAKTYSIYNKRKINFQFQDPKTTNALLVKSGVNDVAGYTKDEICKILNVEYVVQGTVSIEQTSQSSYTTPANAKREKFEIQSLKSEGLLTDSKETSSPSTKTITNYATTMTMNIYNDKGENIFNQDHYTLRSDANSYKMMLKYLAKRSPIYSK